MKRSIISTLRNKQTNTKEFRSASHKLAKILAVESFEFIREDKVAVESPIEKTMGFELKRNIILVPILRAGLSLLPAFTSFYDNARIGFIGLKRDERTHVADEYYKNIPKPKKNTMVIVLDPMIATGGSAVDAINSVLGLGIKQKDILFVSVIASKSGLNKVKKRYPNIKVITAIIDKKLNKDAYIVPGLGDFGDRFFGTV